MKSLGHYCKICGQHKANEKFSGKGHANHICRECASLPAEQKAEMETITKILNLPGYITITQKTWLKNRTEDHRPKVRLLAKQAYKMRFHVEFEYDQEEIAIMDQAYREDCDCERHLTQEEFSQMNPKRKLLDFEIFRQANLGDSAALDAVVQYHRKDFDGYLGKSPDEIDIKLNNELICASIRLNRVIQITVILNCLILRMIFWKLKILIWTNINHCSPKSTRPCA